MSRHRAVRNLDLDDELDDAAFSDEDQEEYPGITPDQQVQLASGLSSVQSVLGTGSGLTDKEIKDALWYYYFDQEKTISYLLDQQHKKNAAKEKAEAAAQRKKAATSSKSTTPASSRPGTPTKSGFKSKAAPASSLSKSTTLPSEAGKTIPSTSTSQLSQDLKGLGLDDDDVYTPKDTSSLPTVSIAKEKLIEDIKRQEANADYKPVLSMVVIGHVDAGKSTLMGRMLAELGEMSERAVNANQRQSEKMGKGSFAHAWALDARPEERERGVTIDIGIDSFTTPHRRFTLLDAPGHRDFIPNMISGASQADTALLVVDASTGAFESGFNEGGQTREHALLVRSFGVQQLVVAVNKLDAVDWSQDRFKHIVETLEPFLVQAGYNQSKLSFIPCGAMSGENLVESRSPALNAWYKGKTIIETLDGLAVPERALEAALRIPVSNVFKGQTTGPSGLGVSGRIESGVVQVGERIAVLPGDETAVVRSIEIDGEPASYATAGSNVTLYLAAIDPLYVNVGCVLCEPEHKIPLATTFLAQIVTFELKFPLTTGSAVEVFYHSKETPATVAKIEATLDKTSGEVIKHSPRMVSKGSSARIAIKLRPSASTGKVASVPIETFAANKNMGRILLRRGGETVAAGIVLKLLE